MSRDNPFSAMRVAVEDPDTRKVLRFGPYVPVDVQAPGDCPECGGQCAPECGLHPLGCVFGGFTDATSYWLIADGCDLDHGETAPA